MLSKWNWIIFNCIVCVIALPLNESPSEAEIKAFLQLIELDYEDACYNTANVQWAFIMSPSTETISKWEVQQHSYAESIKMWRNEVINKTRNLKEQLDPSLQYKYDIIKQPGDVLLKGEDWDKLIHFAGIVELQQLTNSYMNKSQTYLREDVENLLSHSGKFEDKQAVFNTWHHQLLSLVTNYSNNLPLVAKAAKANGAKSVREYWEMLSGYHDGYNKINNEWSRINNLHKKIVKFISSNLAQKYEFTENDTIPAYLFGLQRYDWADISSDVLPHSELIYDIKKNLWKKKYVGKSLYKTASKLGSILLKQAPQAEFWDKSEFNKSCPSRLLNFCQEGAIRVSTCSKATMSNFLRAHEDMGKILFHQMTVESTPILNTINRYSGLEEGISTLFGILSASPAWLNRTHLMNNINDNEQRMIVSLMITALNVLPRLAYYYSADLWRLNAIQENITDPTDLVSSWWKYRQEYEGVSFVDTNNPTFLDDTHIIMNKPYLSKILGIMVSFLLYEYTLDSTEVRYDDINGKLLNGNIIKMIQQGGAHRWPDVLDKFVDIDDISADALISYFTPLEEFIEENEKEFEYKSGAAADEELEELEKHILQEINVPSTTLQSIIKINSTTEALSPNKITSSTKNMQTKESVEKSLESKSSVYIREDKLTNLGSTLPTNVSSNKSSLTFDTLDNTQDSSPKVNTSKAVWAVSAVLVAIVIICIIAIFGRRRCRKTPKNRRYV